MLMTFTSGAYIPVSGTHFVINTAWAGAPPLIMGRREDSSALPRPIRSLLLRFEEPTKVVVEGCTRRGIPMSVGFGVGHESLFWELAAVQEQAIGSVAELDVPPEGVLPLHPVKSSAGLSKFCFPHGPLCLCADHMG